MYSDSVADNPEALTWKAGSASRDVGEPGDQQLRHAIESANTPARESFLGLPPQACSLFPAQQLATSIAPGCGPLGHVSRAETLLGSGQEAQRRGRVAAQCRQGAPENPGRGHGPCTLLVLQSAGVALHKPKEFRPAV